MIQQNSIDGEEVDMRRAKTAKKVECVSCEEKFAEGELLGSSSGPVCESCYENDEMEPAVTVYYDRNDEPHTLGNYHDNTDGDFRAKWISTDAWRGYYDIESDRFVKVHDDNILAYSDDEKELKAFDDALRAYCAEHDIRYARVFARSSNLFSTGYDFFVEKKHIKSVLKQVEKLKAKYRDDERYVLTALTGKSNGFDEKDKFLVAFAGALIGSEKVKDDGV